MDDESGEYSMEPVEEVPLKGTGDSELERLVRFDGEKPGFIPETRGSILEGTICYL